MNINNIVEVVLKATVPDDADYRENMINMIEGMCGSMSTIQYSKMSTEDLEKLFSGCIRRDPKKEKFFKRK